MAMTAENLSNPKETCATPTSSIKDSTWNGLEKNSRLYGKTPTTKRLRWRG